MKKIMFVFFMLLCITIYNKFKINFVSNNIEDKIAIINTNDSKKILINDEILLVISCIDINEINKNLNKINHIITLYDIPNTKRIHHILLNKLTIENISIEKKDNIIKIFIQNNIFCIYNSGLNKNLNDCEYIYFLDIDNIDFNDNVKAIFYDNSIVIKKTEKFYDKWIDSYILDSKTIYILELTKKNYNIYDISITK